MGKRDERGMWTLVLFDLPVKTKEQRRDATAFRKLLLDLGWSMEQFSVYVRYVPTGMSVAPELHRMRRSLPALGRIEIVAITDRQWSKAIRFSNAQIETPPAAPSQLEIF